VSNYIYVYFLKCVGYAPFDIKFQYVDYEHGNSSSSKIDQDLGHIEPFDLPPVACNEVAPVSTANANKSHAIFAHFIWAQSV